MLQPPSLSGQVVGCEPAVLQDVASVIGHGGPPDAMGETWPQSTRSGWAGQAMNTPGRRPKAYKVNECAMEGSARFSVGAAHTMDEPIVIND